MFYFLFTTPIPDWHVYRLQIYYFSEEWQWISAFFLKGGPRELTLLLPTSRMSPDERKKRVDTFCFDVLFFVL